MKLKGMVALCKRDKRVMVLDRHNDDGTIDQYLSDGHNVYPTGDLPPLDTKSVLRVFDVQAEQEGKWTIQQNELPDWLDTSDFATDRMLRSAGVSVTFADGAYLPLWMDERELFWIDCAALAPIEPPFELYARCMVGKSRPMIVAKRGMFFVAALENVELPSSVRRGLIALGNALSAAAKEEA